MTFIAGLVQGVRSLISGGGGGLVRARARGYLLVLALSVGSVFSYCIYLKIKQKRRGIQQTPQNNDTPETANKPRSDRSDKVPPITALSKRTVVTIATIGTLFQTSKLEPDNKDSSATENKTTSMIENKKTSMIENKKTSMIDSKDLQVLKRLALQADLYLITLTDNQPRYDYIHSLLLENGVFAAGLNPVKHLSCSTVIGKAHIVRQLESKIHIDSDEQVVSHLQRFTPHLVLISNNNNNSNSSTQGGDVGYAVSPSLHEQFK